MKILLAEDDVSMQHITKAALSRLAGHTVTVINDGLELISKVAAIKPDLILLDVVMPRMDGFEACLQLKSNPVTSTIPVVYLTGKAEAIQAQQGMSLGAVGYILKPFDPLSLHQQIEDILKKAQTSTS